MINNILHFLLRRNFKDFLNKGFETLNSGKIFHFNWHIDAITEALKNIEKYNKPNRLIINIPPRHLKSTIISVSWPAWLLGQDPKKQIICCSYSQKLSLKLSQDTKIILDSSWYKNTFKDTKISFGENEKHKFTTTERGFRLATSVGSSLIGEGGDVLIVDDPITPLQANSPTFRNKVNDWFCNTFSTRLNNQKTGVIVVVMQRLAENDLTGYLHQLNGWEVLSLPIISDKNRQISIGNFSKDFKKDEILAPALFSEQQIINLRQTLGDHAFSAQYLQNPLPTSSALIKTEDIKGIPLGKIPQGAIVQSWDTASTNSQNSDYSVCLTWLYSNNTHYLIDVYRKKTTYPQLKVALVEMAQKHSPELILIENKASGIALIQEYSCILPIKKITPTADKLTRFLGVINQFEQNNVFIIKDAPWGLDFKQELFSFPHGKHDDMVDALSQYLSWRIKNNMVLPNIRNIY